MRHPAVKEGASFYAKINYLIVGLDANLCLNHHMQIGTQKHERPQQHRQHCRKQPVQAGNIDKVAVNVGNIQPDEQINDTAPRN